MRRASAVCRAHPLLVLATVYTLGLGIWYAFARWIAPDIITAAYQGRSFRALNAMVESRRIFPLDDVLQRWHSLATGLLLAGVCHYLIAARFPQMSRLPERAGGQRAAEDGEFGGTAALAVLAAVFLVATVRYGARGDYGGSFLDEWRAVLSGTDPWFLWGRGVPLNAYGPAFNILALVMWLHPLAPKLLLATGYLSFAVWLLLDVAPRHGLVGLRWWMAVVWLFNPFVWDEVVKWGDFDVLVGLACVAAVHARVRARDVAAGAYLAIGVLLKYLPVVALPFLALDGRRLRMRLIASCLGFVALGLAASVAFWGVSTFQPLRLVGTQYSAGSIYSFLNTVHLPLRPPLGAGSVDWLATPAVAAAGLVVFGWCVARRVEPALGVLAAVVVTVMFYRVGLLRYEMVPFCVGSYACVTAWPRLRHQPVLLGVLATYCAWFAVSEVLWRNIRDLGATDVWGLLTFGLRGTLIIVLMRSSRAFAPEPAGSLHAS